MVICPKEADGMANSLDPEVIEFISCSTQLSIEFFLLINVKMPKIEQENSIISLSELEKAEFLDIFILISI